MSSIRLSISRLVLLVFSCIVLLSSASLSQEFTEPTSFIQAILSRHPSLQKANALIDSAKFGMKASGLQPNPILTLAATAGDAGEDSNSLTQNFEISGQPSLRRSIAEQNLKVSLYQRDAIQKQVIASAYQSWLELWKSQQRSELAQLRTMLFKELARVAKRRFEVGEIAENEALRVELASAQAESDLISAQAAVVGAKESAVLLLDTTSAEFKANPMAPVTLLPEMSLESVLASADQHPEVQGMLVKLSAIEMGAELIKKERAPTLGFSLYRSSLIRSNSIQQGAQVTLSWPILDWGSIRNRAEQQRAQALAFQSEIQEILLENRQSLARVWVRLEAAKKNRDLMASQAEKYEELAREARVAYDIGLLSLTDVLQTEQSYRQAGFQLLEARADVFELELQLIQNTGLSFPAEFTKEYL